MSPAMVRRGTRAWIGAGGTALSSRTSITRRGCGRPARWHPRAPARVHSCLGACRSMHGARERAPAMDGPLTGSAGPRRHRRPARRGHVHPGPDAPSTAARRRALRQCGRHCPRALWLRPGGRRSVGPNPPIGPPHTASPTAGRPLAPIAQLPATKPPITPAAARRGRPVAGRRCPPARSRSRRSPSRRGPSRRPR